MTAISAPEQVSPVRPREMDVDGYLGACAAGGSDTPEWTDEQRSTGVALGRDGLTTLSKKGKDRLDVSNVSVDHEFARAGSCGFVHLDTGRVCQRVHSHTESCEFRLRDVDVSAFIAVEDRGFHASGSSQL